MDNIILLFGGDSPERDISIITACQAYENIDKSKYNIIPIFIYEGHMYVEHNMNIKHFIEYNKHYRNIVVFDKRQMIYLHRYLGHRVVKIDRALLATHGGNGENGALQGYLDMVDIPYSSPDTLASSLLMDKSATKYLLSSLHIPHLAHHTLVKGQYINYVNIVKSLSFPIIVKPCSLGSSIGVGVVTNMESLKEAVDLAFYYDDKVIVEHALEDYKEYNIALFRHKDKVILSDIESPKARNNILGFEDKYLKSGKINGGYREFPADIENNLKESIEKYAITLYNSLHMKGVVRIDYLYKDGKLYLNEANTIPGSLAYYLFEKKDIKYADLVDMMLEEAVIDRDNKEGLIRYYKSSVLKSAKSSLNKLHK